LLAWHPDGRLLAVGYSNGDLRLWDTATGEARPLVGHTQYLWGLQFDPLGEFLASQSWDAAPRFWDPASGQLLLRMQHAGVHQIGRAGRHVAFRNDDGSAGAWEIIRSGVFHSLSSVNTRYPHVRGVDLSRDGRWLVAGGQSDWHLFDLARRTEAASAETTAVVFPFFHPGSRFVLTVEPDQVLRWPLESAAPSEGVRAGSPEIVVSEPGSGFQRGCVSPDGSLVAVAGHHRSLLVDWNDTARVVRFARGRSQSFASLSPDNRWVAAASAVGGGVTIWDTRDGSLIRHLIPSGNAQLAVSRDGRTLATATPGECVLWDTQSWRARHRWTLGLSGGVPVPVTISADNAWVAVAATRTEIRLLDARTGVELATLTSPLPQNVNTLVCSEDGRYLTGETFARAVHLWDLHALRRELAVMKLDW
jgi:WD40 repeat protein